jgi:hypothetical protein
MANKSAEYHEGVLNQDVLKSFFSITGERGSFTWTEGYERIPDNWYKRAIGDEYTISDLIDAAVEYRNFLTLEGIWERRIASLALISRILQGGVYNSAAMLQGDNAVCFAFQALQ